MSYLVKKKDVLFLTAFTVYLFVLILSQTSAELNPAVTTAIVYIRYFCYLLFIIKILLDSYDRKTIWKIFIVVLLVVVTTIQMSETTYLFYLLMIIAAKDVNCRRIIQCACFVQAAALIVFVFGAQFGLVENYLFLQSGERYRYALGFLYTTYAPTIFAFVMMAYLYLRRERMRIYEYAILEGINYWFFVMTDSRVCFYLSTVVLVYVFFMRYFWQNRKERIRKNRWLILTPAAACVGSILLHALYDPEKEIWVTLNEFFNWRLYHGREALDQYPITLFGQKIAWVGHAEGTRAATYNFVDNAYLKILLEGGIVFLILLIAAYTYMMYVAVKINDFYLQTVLLFVLVFCITEARLAQPAFNPFLLLAALAFRTRPMEELFRKEPILIPGFKIRAAQIRFKDREWEKKGGAPWKKMI